MSNPWSSSMRVEYGTCMWVWITHHIGPEDSNWPPGLHIRQRCQEQLIFKLNNRRPIPLQKECSIWTTFNLPLSPRVERQTSLGSPKSTKQDHFAVVVKWGCDHILPKELFDSSSHPMRNIGAWENERQITEIVVCQSNSWTATNYSTDHSCQEEILNYVVLIVSSQSKVSSVKKISSISIIRDWWYFFSSKKPGNVHKHRSEQYQGVNLDWKIFE